MNDRLQLYPWLIPAAWVNFKRKSNCRRLENPIWSFNWQFPRATFCWWFGIRETSSLSNTSVSMVGACNALRFVRVYVHSDSRRAHSAHGLPWLQARLRSEQRSHACFLLPDRLRWGIRSPDVNRAVQDFQWRRRVSLWDSRQSNPCQMWIGVNSCRLACVWIQSHRIHSYTAYCRRLSTNQSVLSEFRWLLVEIYSDPYAVVCGYR